MILNSKVLGHEERVLIILHGLFGSLDNWYGIAKTLSIDYQVHILDQRNHGKSFQNEIHNYDEMSYDLYEYIKSHQIKSPIILGHSMGGKTAMCFALKYPELLKKLIIVDIAPKNYENNYNSLIQKLIEINNAKLDSRKEAYFMLQKTNIDNHTVQFLLKNLFWNNKKLEFRFNLRALNASIEALMRFNYSNFSWDGLTYFIRGSESNYILDSDYKLIKEYFLNSELITIEHANHWVHFDQKEKFIDTIRQIIL